MGRILREGAVLLAVLLIAGGVVLVYTQVALTPNPYDTFPGRVNKLPLQIASPVAGQLLSMPLAVGAEVTKGQVLATIQVLDRNFRMPVDSSLFKLQGDKLLVISPVSGVVAKLNVAPSSTVGGSEKIIELYSVDSTDVWMLTPTSTDLTNYSAFFVLPRANKSKYLLRIEGSIPSDVVPGASSTTRVYRATCDAASGCTDLLIYQQITICAEKTLPRAGLLPQVSLPSIGTHPQACSHN
jgi:hypothetical protein